jgi:hypothetical protein
MTPRIRSLALVVAAGACAAAKQPPASSELAEPSRPLAAFAATRIIAMPTQQLRAPDSLTWTATLPPTRALLAQADSVLEHELRERNLAGTWVFPGDLARSARRNPTYAVDPATVRAGDAVRSLERRPKGNLAEPVASQLRALAGLNDARYALVPVELRLEPAGEGQGRAVLHLAVVDIRGARLDWASDVTGEPMATPSAALASLAGRVVDLVVPR